MTHTNFEEARNNNILRGAYHFLVDSVSGTEQAEHFLSVVNLEKGDLPPVLDMEKDHNTTKLRVTVDQWRTIAKEWLDVVEKHYGVKAIIYTNLNGYGDWIKDDKMLCDHDASSRQHEESFFIKCSQNCKTMLNINVFKVYYSGFFVTLSRIIAF